MNELRSWTTLAEMDQRERRRGYEDWVAATIAAESSRPEGVVEATAQQRWLRMPALAKGRSSVPVPIPVLAGTAARVGCRREDVVVGSAKGAAVVAAGAGTGTVQGGSVSDDEDAKVAAAAVCAAQEGVGSVASASAVLEFGGVSLVEEIGDEDEDDGSEVASFDDRSSQSSASSLEGAGGSVDAGGTIFVAAGGADDPRSRSASPQGVVVPQQDNEDVVDENTSGPSPGGVCNDPVRRLGSAVKDPSTSIVPSSALSARPAPAELLYLRSQTRLDRLLSYLTSARYPIVPLLLSPSGLHSEVLKRLPPLIKFLARHGRLDKGHIRLLWDAGGLGGWGITPVRVDPMATETVRSIAEVSGGGSGGGVLLHESVTTAVLDLIQGLLRAVEADGCRTLLDANNLLFLSRLLGEVRDGRRWTAQSLGLVEMTCQGSLDLIGEVVAKGNDERNCDSTDVDHHVLPCLDLLWTLAMEGNNTSKKCPGVAVPVGRDVADVAMSNLLRIFERAVRECEDSASAGRGKVRTVGFVGPVLPREQVVGCEASYSPPLSTAEEKMKRVVRGMRRAITYLLGRTIDTIADMSSSSSSSSSDNDSYSTASCVKTLGKMLLLLPLRCGENFRDREDLKSLVSIEEVIKSYDLFSLIVLEASRYAHLSSVSTVSQKPSVAHTLERVRLGTVANRVDNCIFVGGRYTHSECSGNILDLFLTAVERTVGLCYCYDDVELKSKDDDDGSMPSDITAFTLGNFSEEGLRHPKRQRTVRDAGKEISLVSHPVVIMADEDDVEVDDIDDMVTSPVEPLHHHDGCQKLENLHAPQATQTSLPLGKWQDRLLPKPRHIVGLWSSFIKKGFSQESADATLRALRSVLLFDPGMHATRQSGNGPRVVSSFAWSDVKRQLTLEALYPLCLKLDPHNMGKASYALFVHVIGSVNLCKKNYVEMIVSDDIKPQSGILKESGLMKKAMTDVLLGRQTYLDLGITNGSLKPALLDFPLIIDVANYGVCGLSQLWSVVLNVQDEDVAGSAMLYLSTLYAHLPMAEAQGAVGEGDRTGKVQKAFVARCMSELGRRGSDSTSFLAGDHVHWLRKERVVRLLTNFSELLLRTRYASQEKSASSDGVLGIKHLFSLSHGYYATAAATALSSSSDVGVTAPLPTTSYPALSIQVQPLNLRRFTVTCPMGSSTCLGYLRRIIRDRLAAEKNVTAGSGGDVAAEYRLIYGGREIVGSDSETLDGLGLAPDCVVHCCPRLSTAALRKGVTSGDSIVPKPTMVKFGTDDTGSGDADAVLPTVVGNHWDNQPGGDAQPVIRGVTKLGAPGSESLVDASSTCNSPITKLHMESVRYKFNPKEKQCQTLVPGIAEIVSHENMDHLFSLLCVDGSGGAKEGEESVATYSHQMALRDSVWELLQLLPTEPRLKDALEFTSMNGIASPEWKNWLPSPVDGTSAAFRLLYGLQLVESLIIHNPSALNKRQSQHIGRVSKRNVPMHNVASVTVDGNGCEVNAGIAKKGAVSGTEKIGIVVDIPRTAVCGNGTGTAEVDKKYYKLRQLPQPYDTIPATASLGEGPKWCSQFVALGGFRHLVNLLASLRLSEGITEGAVHLLSSDCAFQHESSRNSQGFEKSTSCPSDLLIFLRCANKLLRLIGFFTEKGDEEVEDNISQNLVAGKAMGEVTIENPARLVRCLLRLISGTCSFQVSFIFLSCRKPKRLPTINFCFPHTGSIFLFLCFS